MVSRKPAYYQSKYRERLREKGYVKREIWIPPDYAAVLKDCETALRAGIIPIIPKTRMEENMSQDDTWTTESLLEALQQSSSAADGNFTVELVDGADPGILVTMNEFGDLPLLISVSGSQIIVDTLLWPVEEVNDSASFNEMILRTHKLFPLSTFGIGAGPDGREYYEMFGSLSAGSILDSVIFEIETLADNALQAAEAYRSDMKKVA